MSDKTELKQLLINQLQKIVQDKIDSALISIESAKEARDSETKSSVGDKYETGRAMMHFEIEKNNVQLSKARQLENDLSKIDTHKIHDKVEFGSLVFTNKGNYFISIGLGKIEINKQVYFSVSPASPIGKSLAHKRVEDRIVFQSREIIISDIF